MRQGRMLPGVAATLLALATAACSDGGGKLLAQTSRSRAAVASAPGEQHQMKEADGLQWGPAPSIFPPGAMFAVVQGDPSVPGQIFTVRLRFPNGYVLPPHWHPTDEHVTVLHGTFLVGMGSVYSKDALIAVHEDGFVTAPAQAPHFASARGITEVQVHAIGPFQLTYVNPADDPTRR